MVSNGIGLFYSFSNMNLYSQIFNGWEPLFFPIGQDNRLVEEGGKIGFYCLLRFILAHFAYCYALNGNIGVYAVFKRLGKGINNTDYPDDK